MAYRIRIEEIQDDRLVKLYDEIVEQGILKCENAVGMFGFRSPMEIILEMREFSENLAIQISNLDEKDDPDDDDILAAVITECVIGINLAALALGPITETDVIRDEVKRSKLRKHAFEMIEMGKEIASLCDIIHVDTLNEYKQKLGEMLMDELDSMDKDED